MSGENGVLKKFFSKVKIEYLIVIALAAICLIVVFGGITTSNKSNEKSDIEDYVSNLEDKLQKNLSKVRDAGKVSVIISVDSKMETVLATVKKSDVDTVYEEPFTVGGKTVVLTETYPKVSGVIIVAEGADNLSVKLALMNATKVFLDIDSEKIQILPMRR